MKCIVQYLYLSKNAISFALVFCLFLSESFSTNNLKMKYIYIFFSHEPQLGSYCIIKTSSTFIIVR